MTKETVINVPRDRASINAWRVALCGTVASMLMVAGGGLWLAAPGLNPFHAEVNDAPFLTWFGPSAFALALLVTGILGAVLGLMKLRQRMRFTALSALVALAVAAVAGFGLLGSGSIVMAGYMFAFTLPIGLAALIIAWGRRRPVRALVAGAVLIAGVVVGQVSGLAPFLTLYSEIGQTMADRWVEFSMVMIVIVMASAWALWVLIEASARRLSGFARWVVRWRQVITITAAACALPYATARATWLTPWPQFAGPTEEFAQHPEMRVLGLMLGAAVLTGGVLTLGLIMRWGERFPRWIPGVAGRPVPVALAAVPGAIAAALFTFGGPSVAAITVGAGATGLDSIFGLLILPFWLWGPLLALAVWGYVLHRRAA